MKASICVMLLIYFLSIKSFPQGNVYEYFSRYSIKLALSDACGRYVRRELCLMHLYAVVVSCHVENATVVFNEASKWCIIAFNW